MAESESRRRVSKDAEDAPVVGFTPERILAEPEAFGHPRHVLAGALHGVSEDATLTRDALDKRVAVWLGMTVE